jgi:hypothetical protein
VSIIDDDLYYNCSSSWITFEQAQKYIRGSWMQTYSSTYDELFENYFPHLYVDKNTTSKKLYDNVFTSVWAT